MQAGQNIALGQLLPALAICFHVFVLPHQRQNNHQKVRHGEQKSGCLNNAQDTNALDGILFQSRGEFVHVRQNLKIVPIHVIHSPCRISGGQRAGR